MKKVLLMIIISVLLIVSLQGCDKKDSTDNQLNIDVDSELETDASGEASDLDTDNVDLNTFVIGEPNEDFPILSALNNSMSKAFPELYSLIDYLSKIDNKGYRIDYKEPKTIPDGTTSVIDKVSYFDPDVGTLTEINVSAAEDKFSLSTFAGKNTVVFDSDSLLGGAYGASSDSFYDTLSTSDCNEALMEYGFEELSKLFYRSCADGSGNRDGIVLLMNAVLNNATMTLDNKEVELHDGKINCDVVTYTLNKGDLCRFYKEISKLLETNDDFQNLYYSIYNPQKASKHFLAEMPDHTIRNDVYKSCKYAAKNLLKKAENTKLKDEIVITGCIVDGMLCKLIVDANAENRIGMKLDLGVNGCETDKFVFEYTYPIVGNYANNDYYTLRSNVIINEKEGQKNYHFETIYGRNGKFEEYKYWFDFSIKDDRYVLSYNFFGEATLEGSFSIAGDTLSFSVDKYEEKTDFFYYPLSFIPNHLLSYEITLGAQDVSYPEYTDVLNLNNSEIDALAVQLQEGLINSYFNKAFYAFAYDVFYFYSSNKDDLLTKNHMFTNCMDFIFYMEIDYIKESVLLPETKLLELAAKACGLEDGTYKYCSWSGLVDFSDNTLPGDYKYIIVVDNGNVTVKDYE